MQLPTADELHLHWVRELRPARRAWPARGAPLVVDGTVYFAAGIWPFQGIFVYALDAETGEVDWANTGEGITWQAQPHGGAYAKFDSSVEE